jgi:peptidyl-dipeptidase A
LGSQGDIELIKKIIEKSTKIEKIFNKFRAKIGDKEYSENDIKEILEKETDNLKLEEAWKAIKEQGAIVEKEVIELVKLRNKLAQSLGFENYYIMSLELSEQDINEVSGIFDNLAELSEEPFKRLKQEIDGKMAEKFGIEIKDLRPWHYGDLFFQEGPKIYNVDLDGFYSKDLLDKAVKFYSSLGYEVRDILERSDLYEKLGKYPHACCIDIDRKGDIRTIQNLKNNEKSMETLLHELGHAIYDKYVDSNLPYLLRRHTHIFVTEAIAQLFGRNSKNFYFINNYGDKKIDLESAEELRKSLRLRQLVFSRWSQVMFRFEKEMYFNPEQNLNELWWNLVKKYQLIDFSRDNPDWASKIHLASSPVYYHNYLLGELLASQLSDYIIKNISNSENEFIDFSNRKIGEYLKEKIFFPGKKYLWNELIEKATGEKLNPKHFVKEFLNQRLDILN